VRLRDYQREAVSAILEARSQGIRRMVVALPTGAGKTVIFAELIRRARADVLVLAHRRELLSQAKTRIEDALSASGQSRRIVAVEQGKISAPYGASVLVASLRSLHEGRIGRVIARRNIRLVIYDECHHAVAPENVQVLDRLGVFEADWPGTLVGVTATTRRADGVGLDKVFEKIVYSRSLGWMIERGYLRRLKGLRIQTKVDLSRVAVKEGEWEAESLAEAVDVEERTSLVARSIQDLAVNRRTIAFCVGVQHAENLSRRLNELGVRAGMVCGEMPEDDRERTLKLFRIGALQVVTNVGVLTEGYDDPGVSCIAMVRPTRSESLYLQCIGRGMRIHVDASDCLVLDFVDLSELAVVNLPSLVGERPADEVEEHEEEDSSHEKSEPAQEGLASSESVPPPEDIVEVPLTVQEIRARTSGFDPLTMALAETIAAVSINAWIPLASGGAALSFLNDERTPQNFLVRPREGRVRGYNLYLADKCLATFQDLESATIAVDGELANYGVAGTGRRDALWRARPVGSEMRAALRALSLAERVTNLGDAMAILAREAGVAKESSDQSKPRLA